MLESQEESKQTIKQLLDTIASREEKDERHAYSSVKPRLNYDEEVRYLDCLARLITSNETCVALCERDGELLVASNLKSPEYAKTYIPKLRAYLKNPTGDTYASLEREVQSQISERIRKDSFSDFMSTYQFLGKTNQSLYESMEEHYESGTLESLKNIISEFSTILSQDTVNRKMLRIASNIMRPLIDTKTLVSEINQEQHRTLKQAILEGNVQYVPGAGGKHAEVKISEHLYDTQGRMYDGGRYYIGITKLTCGPCDLALQTFSEATGRDIELRYAGTHGGTYRGWQKPNWIKPGNPAYETFKAKLNEVKKIPLEDLSNKAREAAPLVEKDMRILSIQLPHEITVVEEREKSKQNSATIPPTAQPKEYTRTTSGVAAGEGVGEKKFSSWAEMMKRSTSTARADTLVGAQRATVGQAQTKPTRQEVDETVEIIQSLQLQNKPMDQTLAGGGRGTSLRGRQARGRG